MVLSTIGDPKLVILDEVTTGLDPVSTKPSFSSKADVLGTRDCWNFIEYFKKGRLIMLVTHSMEEAELLSDSVIVMQKGEIVAAGTPLRLKSKYGAGYRLSLASTSSPETTRPPVESAKLESSAAGEIIWRIENAADLGKVVRWADEMEHNTRRRGKMKQTEETEEDIKVQGWEISMPTLEEVLLEKKLF
jgi:ABC-type multidrug transport system ATPase subunit